MITTAIRPAIRPYSMAVAPDWSAAKRAKSFFMFALLVPDLPQISNCKASFLSAGTSWNIGGTDCDHVNPFGHALGQLFLSVESSEQSPVREYASFPLRRKAANSLVSA